MVSPGIDFRAGAIQGYDRGGDGRSMPPACNDGAQVALLRRQLEAMEDGGTVVISSPVNPARCPPAPYERASLIAHYLKTKKPRSKVIVLDAKDSFTMQKLFEAAWKELYPGLIEWVGLSQGGALTSVDAATKTLVDRFRQVQGRGRQRHPAAEGRPRRRARRRRRPHRLVPGRSGDVSTRKLQPNIHVIGDAAIAGAMPRSASAAHSQAQICAAAIAALLAGKTPAAPTLTSLLLQPDRAGLRDLAEGHLPPGRRSVRRGRRRRGHQPAGCAARAARKAEADEADAWYRTITGEVFG